MALRLELEEVKDWLRVSGDEENRLISSLMDASISYLRTATGKEKFGMQTDLAKLVCKYLITNWYENRDSMNPTPNSIRSPFLTAMIVQLQYGGE